MKKGIVAFAMVAVLSFGFWPAAFAAGPGQGYYSVYTSSGSPVNVRDCSFLSCNVIDRVASGEKVYVYCYGTGQTVTGKYGTSNIWDYVKTSSGKLGMISDTYIYTGSDKPVVPDCNDI